MAAKKKARRKKAAKRTTKRKATRRKAPKRKGAARKARAKAPKRKAARKKAPTKAPKAKAKRKPNPAFMKALTPSPALAEIVGSNPLPRTEVVKRLWDYIRANGLQDQVNRRMINADDRLQQVFGGRTSVSMFEMAKLISPHLS
jgi:chromatin remodeling complex protein RSC6